MNALVKFLLSDFGVPMMRAVIDLFEEVVDTLVMLVVSRRGVLSCVEFCERNRHFLQLGTLNPSKLKFDVYQGSIVGPI